MNHDTGSVLQPLKDHPYVLSELKMLNSKGPSQSEL